jgi:hypothetical protein
MDAEPATIWVCQGPPRCALEGDEAVAAQQAGCVWCKRVVIFEDGTERAIEPGNA